MRASVLFVCVLVAVALACPLKKHSDSAKCSCQPKVIPLTWKVRTFETQSATINFQGIWYLQMTTPTCINGATPLKTGIFYNVWPSSCNRLLFFDDTQGNSKDFNLNYYMLDSSFNQITQTIDNSQSVFRPAYQGSNWAVFNVGTEQTYKTAIKETNPLTDETLIKYKLDSDYTREYTVAILGSDSDWKEYMVFAVLNEYENVFSGSDKHIIWVLTRDKNPCPSIYKKAFDDIVASGLSPYSLVSVDQSIDLETVPTINDEDIKGVVKRTTKQTEESCSSSSNGVVTSSKKTTVEETTTCVSTVDYTVNPKFIIPYNYSPSEWSGKINILKDLTLQQYADAFNGKYYLNTATPISCDENGTQGLLNTVFPYTSPQVDINVNNGPWQYGEQYMMVERSINAITGDTVTKRYILQIASNDGSVPYASVLVYAEGCYTKTIQEVSPLSYDKVTVKIPSSIYTQTFVLGVAAYQENQYLILYMYNQLPNKINPEGTVHPLYIFTRQRTLSQTDNENITQELLRIGYPPNYLVHLDQTKKLDESKYNFDKSYFYPSNSPSTPNFPLGQPIQPKGISTLLPPNYPSSGTRSLGPVIPRSGSCPSSIPSQLKVKTFNSQQATIALQGLWNLQLVTPTKIKGSSPLKTGLFANIFPCAKSRLILLDTTPCDMFDFNLDYYWLDTSFNVYTQRVETVQGLVKAAYPSTNWAIFNVCTPKYYSDTIVDISTTDDSDQVRHKLDKNYEREFTVAIIGSDDSWQEYMVFVVINKYSNIFSDDYLIWVFTRSENVDSTTYKKVYDDILASGLSPYGLIAVDQSIDLSSIPTVTEDDINGVVQTTVVKTEEKKETKTSSDGTLSSTSSKKQTTIETKSLESPFNIVVSPDYVSPYQYDVCKTTGGVKIIKNLSPKDQSMAFSGKYYVHMATPLQCSETGKVGALNTKFPARSLYVQFQDYDGKDWSPSSQYLMLDGGLNGLTGQVDKTRSVFKTAYDTTTCSFNTYAFYTEGYYTNGIIETQPYSYENLIAKSPSSKIYGYKYIASIAAYKEGSFLALYVHNTIKNSIGESKNQMLVMARNRLLTAPEIYELTQAIANTGYDLTNLICIDQTQKIEEVFTLDPTYFEIVSESSSSSSVVQSSSSTISVIEESSSSSSSIISS